MKNVSVVDNQFVKDALGYLRDKNTDRIKFRYFADRLNYLLISNLMNVSDTVNKETETPLTKTTIKKITHNFIIIPILRSGVAMLPQALQLFPNAKVGFAGLVRDEKTAIASEYYWKIPKIGKDDIVLIIDPMLATGGSVLHVVKKIMPEKPRDIRIASIVASSEGIREIHGKFPKVQIFTAAIDEKLNSKKYIVPGLGDFGDRYFGTD